MRAAFNVVPPGGTLGILGGGHIGRMTAIAARALGYRTHVLEMDPACSSEDVAERSVHATRHNVRAAVDLAANCDVVTVSSEDIAYEMLESVSFRAPLRPSLPVLALAQHRVRERSWLGASGFDVVPWREAHNREELVAAVSALGVPCIVKPQLRRRAELRPLWVTSPGEAACAWSAMRGLPTVVEAVAQIATELTVLVARTPTGAVATYPPAVGIREHGGLVWATLPGGLPPQVAERAQQLAARVARELGVEGLLTVELFLLADGRLVVNELVPCPHPTYNATELACETDQFDQLVRCITGLPLGATDVLQPAVTMVIGSRSRLTPARAHERPLRIPGVRAHLYASAEGATQGTAGHLCATGATLDEAASRAMLAATGIGCRHARRPFRPQAQLAASSSRRRPNTGRPVAVLIGTQDWPPTHTQETSP